MSRLYSVNSALTRVSADLLLRDDDLGGEGVLGVWDRVVQQADTAHHLARLQHRQRRVRSGQVRSGHGMMIWVERASLVFGIGWSSRQIQRTTWPDCRTDRSGQVTSGQVRSRDDDLGREGVLGVWDRVVQQADTAHHLARLQNRHTHTETGQYRSGQVRSRDDDLGREGVLGVWDRVVQQADTAHHLARLQNRQVRSGHLRSGQVTG